MNLYVESIKSELSAASLEAAWAAGRQMDVDQAIALALSD